MHIVRSLKICNEPVAFFVKTEAFMKNPFKTLSQLEWLLYLGSLLSITASFLLCQNYDFTVLIASLIGTTALIFVSKGDPFGQIMTVVFALFYGWISLGFRYYGEMITYLGMTAPIAIASTVAWFKNPYQKGKSEVKVSRLTPPYKIILVISTAAVTFLFYFILKYFDTPNLFWSTVSIATSFSASYLTLMRNPYYAIAYAANDIVLMVLWVLASIESPSYIPMVVCFAVFLANDSYGFINWQRIERRQNPKTI